MVNTNTRVKGQRTVIFPVLHVTFSEIYRSTLTAVLEKCKVLAKASWPDTFIHRYIKSIKREKKHIPDIAFHPAKHGTGPK
jgi:hypothetical protein